MRKLSIHARIEIILLTALLLGSCGDDLPRSKFSAAERDEIRDIAGDGAVDAEEFENLRVRVIALEERLQLR